MRNKVRAMLIAAFFIFAAVTMIFIAKKILLPELGDLPLATQSTEAEPAPVDAWVQTAKIEPGVDYVIVSCGHALTSNIVAYGDGGGHSFVGVPVSTEGGVLRGEVTPEMLWRFEIREDTRPGDAYYAADDMLITQNGRPIVRDFWRGDTYMRFCVWQDGDEEYLPEQSSWQILRRGDVFYLSAVSGSEDTNNLFYYSKYYGAFLYTGSYPDMTQPLFAIKLFRYVDSGDQQKEIEAVGLMLEEPAAGRPALGAYAPKEVTGYRVQATRWSDEPSVFASETEYAATVTVKACGGYKFAEGAEVTVNGTPVTATGDDYRLTVTVAFPKTGRAPQPETDETADPRTLLVTSDMHKYTDKLYSFLKRLRATGAYPRTVSFAGDMYTAGGGFFKRNWRGYTESVRAVIASVFPASQPVYTMGNHDWESLYDESYYDGAGSDCFATLYGYARVGAVYPGGDTASPYVIFNIGATDVTHGEYYSMFRDTDLQLLRSFLERTDGSGKLIVVNSHWPLHFAYNAGERTVLYAEKAIDLLNEFADKNDIIFVWGHNHYDDPAMLTVRGPGDTIVCDKEGTISRKIKFIYANAGAMLYGTGGLVTFDEKNIRLVYYSLPDDGSDTLVGRGSHLFKRVGR